MVSPDRLELYKDFVVLHADGNGNYDPEKGLGSLLSVTSPDTKLVTLAGMDEEKPYFSKKPLHKDVLMWLKNLGIPRNAFPITTGPTWRYCERRIEKGIKQDGSLVKIGAVIKPAYLRSLWGDEKTGYIKSIAGSRLAVPFLPYICEFVYQTRQSNIPHRFNSMWRLLGASASSTDQRRPLAVFKVVEFLIKHSGNLRTMDIAEGLVGQVGDTAVSSILNNLGDDEKGQGAGIIHYESPSRDIQGKSASGLSKYGLINVDKLQDIDSLYAEIRKRKKYFRDKVCLTKIAHYILQNPKDYYEYNELAEELDINKSNIPFVLSILSDLNVLDHQSMFKVNETQSQASATDLTKMFYERVLLPIKEAAYTLTPPPYEPLEPSKLTYLLQNYSQERSYIGPQGGEEVREIIVTTLVKLGEAKLSHIAEEYNQITERKLRRGAIYNELIVLTEKGLIKRPKRGYYKLV